MWSESALLGVSARFGKRVCIRVIVPYTGTLSELGRECPVRWTHPAPTLGLRHNRKDWRCGLAATSGKLANSIRQRLLVTEHRPRDLARLAATGYPFCGTSRAISTRRAFSRTPRPSVSRSFLLC